MKLRFTGRVFPNFILSEVLSLPRDWKESPKKEMSSNKNNVTQTKIIKEKKIIKENNTYHNYNKLHKAKPFLVSWLSY